MESLSCNKFWAGPSDTNDSNGKRKAQSELNTSPTLSCSPLDNLLISNGLVITGLDQDPVVNVGRVSKELHKQKPKSGSVKGKKDYARSREVLSIPISAKLDKGSLIIAASDEKSLSTHANWSSSISKLHPEINGEFIFSANPDINMGDQLRRVGYGDAGGDYGGNPSLHSTEVSLPFSVDECRPGLPAIDKSGLGNEERTKVEALLQAGSVGALCGIDVG